MNIALCTCYKRLLISQADVLLGFDGSDRGKKTGAADNACHNGLSILVPRHLNSTLIADDDLGLHRAVFDQVLELLDLGSILDRDHLGLELTDLQDSSMGV